MVKKSWLLGILGGIVTILILDRVSKWWALANLAPPIGTMQEPIPGLLRFIYVENRGVAFGMFQNNGGIFVLLSSLVLLFVVWQARSWIQTHGAWAGLSVMLILAGGIGNLIDRVLYGFVVDFIHLIPLPIFHVFNVADMAISFGGVLLFVVLWREDAAARRMRATKANNGGT